jgi:hypothetical protein
MFLQTSIFPELALYFLSLENGNLPNFMFTVLCLANSKHQHCPTHAEVCLSKVSEPHMHKLNQLLIQTHFHAHSCAWIAASISFTTKLITDNIYAMPGTIYNVEFHLLINSFCLKCG